MRGPLEAFPATVLGARRADALLFKRLATLRADAALFADIGALRWVGPTPAFADWAERMERPRLLQKAQQLAARVGSSTSSDFSRKGAKKAR